MGGGGTISLNIGPISLGIWGLVGGPISPMIWAHVTSGFAPRWVGGGDHITKHRTHISRDMGSGGGPYISNDMAPCH